VTVNFWTGFTWLSGKVTRTWQAGGITFYRIKSGKAEYTVKEKDVR
jgi:hypothetical protein